MSRRAPRQDWTQPDLFGEVDRARIDRLIAALTCMKDVVPDALEIVTTLAPWRERDSRKPHSSGSWAYTVCHAGLRFEHLEQWWTEPQSRGEPYGWDRTPAELVTWDELQTLLHDDPRRAAVIDWARQLSCPDRWRDLSRPYELWPNPDDWHPGWIDGDHARTGWSQRLQAWRTVLEILTAAIDRLTVEAACLPAAGVHAPTSVEACR